MYTKCISYKIKKALQKIYKALHLSRGGRIRTCDLLLPKQAR